MPNLRPLIAALLCATGCTDVDILLPEVQPPPPPEVKPNMLVGQFCTEDPATVVYPLKVWLVIDDSGSMQQNDPNQKRYTGVMDLATRLGSPGKVFFGGEVFSGDQTKRFSNGRFVDDVTLFNTQVAAVANAGNGQTPYLGALNLTLSELTADIMEGGSGARRTRYVIIFLSDGQPTDSQPAEILAAMDQLMALKDKVGGLTLNTVFLGGDLAAATLLQQMATKGEGVFKSFPNGDALDYTGFDFSTIRRSYLQRFFMATNTNMVSTGKLQVVDSDGDSISDQEEVSQGLDPAKRDSDGDGCNDALELKLGWDPKAKKPGECTCKATDVALDADHDGLNNCEESWLGTLSTDPDSDIGKAMGTDGDLVPDGLDFYQLKDATFPNVSTDRDLDGVLDIEELRVHTDLELADHDRARWAYTYPVFEKNAANSRCFDFEVHNVTLGRTLATDEHAADENVIEVHFAQSSADDPHHDRIYRVARLKVPYAEGNRVVRVQPSDFATLLGP
ncbi:MAG: VWA domain-containing protein [Archangiaceae bacterium]|nr:VWA domain-containing protein [Archangiaceae bacterium]